MLTLHAFPVPITLSLEIPSVKSEIRVIRTLFAYVMYLNQYEMLEEAMCVMPRTACRLAWRNTDQGKSRAISLKAWAILNGAFMNHGIRIVNLLLGCAALSAVASCAQGFAEQDFDKLDPVEVEKRIADLKSDDAGKRVRAAMKLGEWFGRFCSQKDEKLLRKSLPALREALADPELRVSEKVVEALGNWAECNPFSSSRRRVPPEWVKEIVPLSMRTVSPGRPCTCPSNTAPA